MKENQQPSLVFKPLKEDSDYLIQSDGSLQSKKRNRFLTGKIDSVGYRVYALAISNKLSVSGKKLGKMVYAHRLVAEYFLPNPDNLPYVHHKDENKLNNSVENLQWVSESENVKAHLEKHEIKRPAPQYYSADLKDETWKIFPENPAYSISSLGRVKNNKTNRLLKIDENQKQSRIQLCQNKKKIHYYIHRLVYCTFANDFNLDGFVIDHIDGNPRNNAFTNLQKITQQENCLKQERFNDQFT